MEPYSNRPEKSSFIASYKVLETSIEVFEGSHRLYMMKLSMTFMEHRHCMA
jgi:hypothetical protein